MSEPKQKLPYFMQGTEANLKLILADGGLYGDLDRAMYVYLKDTGELAYVEANKTIHKIVGSCKKQVLRVSALPPPSEGDDEVLYLFGDTIYLYDKDEQAYYPSYKDIDMRVEEVEKTLNDTLDELKEINSDIEAIKEELSHITFKEIVGTVTNPVIIADLESGIYGIRGQYKISSILPTTYSTTVTLLFFVAVDEDGKINIKKITSTDITDYVIVDDIVTTDKVVMQSYLDNLEIVDKEYVDNQLKDVNKRIDEMSKTIVEEVVQEVVKDVEEKIDETVDERITENFDTCSSEDIENLFK